MKKYIITFILIISFIPSVTQAWTKSDIDLLVTFDIITDEVMIPLLYALAEDTPAPTTEEILAFLAARDESSESTKDDEDVDEDEDKSEAIRAEVITNINTDAYVEEAEIAGQDEKGVFVFEFELSASGNDLYIEDSVATSSAGFTYSISDNFNGSAIAFITDSTAEKVGDTYKIPEGTEVSFRIEVELDPTVSDVFSVQLRGLKYANNSSLSGAIPFTFSDRSKFRTNKVLIEG